VTDFVFFWLSSYSLPSFYRVSMPRPRPHPLALFSLYPLNARAKDVVAHPGNSHLVSACDEVGNLVLDVGFHIRSQSRNTLATLGRSDTDIILEGSNALSK
jgi:hypothetical protein